MLKTVSYDRLTTRSQAAQSGPRLRDKRLADIGDASTRCAICMRDDGRVALATGFMKPSALRDLLQGRNIALRCRKKIALPGILLEFMG